MNKLQRFLIGIITTVLFSTQIVLGADVTTYVLDQQIRDKKIIEELKKDFSQEKYNFLLESFNKNTPYFTLLGTMKMLGKRQPFPHDEIITLYENNPVLATHYQSRIEMMRAYEASSNRTNYSSQKLQALVAQLIKDYPQDGNLHYKIGLMYRKNGDINRGQRHLRQAFSKHMHYDINAGLELLRQNTSNYRHAQILVLACLKEGADIPYNNRAARTLIETAITADIQVDNKVMEYAMLVIAHNQNHQDAVTDLQYVEKLLKASPNNSANPKVKIFYDKASQIVTLRKKVIDNDQAIINLAKNPVTKQKQELTTLKNRNSKIEEQISKLNGPDFNLQLAAISFRGAFQEGKVISGNMKYGGPIADTIVNKADLEDMKILLNKSPTEIMHLSGVEVPPNLKHKDTKLVNIINVEEFLEVGQQIVRLQFQTEKFNLECIDDQKHVEVFDDIIANHNRSHGFDSKDLEKAKECNGTNSIFEFINGIGDCRHHTIAMQLMYDSWNEFRINNEISKVELSGQGQENVAKLLEDKLIILDSQMHAPIKVNGLYKPKRLLDEGGNPNLSKFIRGDMAHVEDHTTTLYLTKGQIISFDSFYQNTYSLAKKELSYTFDTGNRFILSGFTINQGGATIGAAIMKQAPYRRTVAVASGSEHPSLADPLARINLGQILLVTVEDRLKHRQSNRNALSAVVKIKIS